MPQEIGIIGFGNQGEAWALNLRDSGWNVRIFLRPDSTRVESVRRSGFSPENLDRMGEPPILAVLIPDDAMPAFCRDHFSSFRPSQSLVFAHGFSLHFRTADWPRTTDWILVAPKGIASAVRERYLLESGVPAILAVENDATGHAWETANAVAAALGAERAGTYRATVRDEVEADLVSEQALLCGGLPRLVAETYDVLVKQGIPEEVAYLECVHELAYMADLFQRRGIGETLRTASPTAQFGGWTAGHRLIGPSTRELIEGLLSRIRSGEFLRDLSEEARNGYPQLEASQTAWRETPMEEVGRSIRAKITKVSTT